MKTDCKTMSRMVFAQEAKETNTEKADLLYKTLITKASGYLGIVNALHETRQTGAYSTLSVISSDMIKNLQISNLKKTVGELLNKNQVEEIESWINANFSADERFKMQEATFGVNLLRETIPLEYPLYISRFLSRRLAVNYGLFEDTCHDVFVFKNITRERLRETVKKNSIESSGSQLSRKKFTTRFILLDIHEDWQRIRNKLNHTPVHLLRYEEASQTFLLEATSGVSNLLDKHLKVNENINSERLSEDDFIEKILSENMKGVCICDVPGMGKTLLLAELARKLNQTCSNSLVGFIDLRRFDLPNQSQGPDVIMSIVEHISTSVLASRVHFELLKSKAVTLELFFDRLDEVEEVKLPYTLDFLRKICKSMLQVRVYVTSRPVARDKLEMTLKVIAYDIDPFDEETQLQYLTSSWLAKGGSSARDRLYEYGKHFLRKFKLNLKKSEDQIAGIPLQCKLLAEVLWEEAIAFADPNRNNSPELSNNFAKSMLEVYSNYMEGQFGQVNCNFDCMKHYVLTEIQCDNVRCQVKRFHVWKAIQLIFPEIANTLSERNVSYLDNANFQSRIFSSIFRHNATCATPGNSLKLYRVSNKGSESNTNFLGNLTLQTKLYPGILELRRDGNAENPELEFVHRTFAEFLVAEYFAKAVFTQLMSTKEQKAFQQAIFDKVISPGFAVIVNRFLLQIGHLSRLAEPVVAYFLDAILAETVENDNNILCTAQLLPSTGFFKALEGCMHEESDGLLNVFLKAAENSKYDQLIEFEVEELENVLRVATVMYRVNTVDKIYKFLLKYFKVNQFQVQTNIHKFTPLQLAAARGDPELAEYCVETMMVPIEGTIFTCLMNTYFQSPDLVDKKLEIAKMLCKDRPTLSPSDFGCFPNPIFAPKLHLGAIKFLVGHGLNFRETYALLDNVCSHAAQYMSAEDFTELCQTLNVHETNLSLPDHFQPGIFLFSDTSFIRFPDACEPRTTMLVVALQDLYAKSHFTETFEKAVERTRLFIADPDPVTILKTFLSVESYKTHKIIFSTIFRLALREKLTEVAELLLTFDPSLVTMTVESLYNGPVPILFDAKWVEEVKFLVERGANVFELDRNGRTILHALAEEQIHVHQPFEELCYPAKLFGNSLFPNNVEKQQKSYIDQEAWLVQKSPIKLFNDVVQYLGTLWDALPGSDDASTSSAQLSTPVNLKQLFNWPTMTDQRTPLHSVLTFFNQTTNLDMMDMFLRGGRTSEANIVVNINAVNIIGNTALHDALFFSILVREDNINIIDISMIKLLVRHGADVCIRNKFGWDLAQTCAKFKLAKHLTYFTEMGMNNSDEDTNTSRDDMHANDALQGASANERPRGISKSTGIDFSWNSFFAAIVAGEKTCLPEFLGIEMKPIDKYGTISLHAALHMGCNLEIINDLLLRGVDFTILISSKNKDGCNVTHICAEKCLHEHLEYFMELGVDINEVDSKGNTALQCGLTKCPKRNYAELAKILVILVEAGADIAHVNLERKTAYDIAKETGFWCDGDDVLEYLKVGFSFNQNQIIKTSEDKSAINIHTVDNEGNNALHTALKQGCDLDFVKDLVSRGIDFETANNKGCNVLHICVQYGLTEHLKYFVGLGIDVNQIDFTGNNSLQCGLSNLSTKSCNIDEIVKTLLHAGVSKLQTNYDNKTAYQIAIENEFSDSIQEMLKVNYMDHAREISLVDQRFIYDGAMSDISSVDNSDTDTYQESN